MFGRSKKDDTQMQEAAQEPATAPPAGQVYLTHYEVVSNIVTNLNLAANNCLGGADPTVIQAYMERAFAWLQKLPSQQMTGEPNGSGRQAEERA